MATVTLTQTDSPSRSKQAGPCWIAAGGVYATTGGRSLEREPGDRLTVDAKVELRRAGGRSDVARRSWTVVVTGDGADTVTVTLGSPQSVTAVISGVREA